MYKKERNYDTTAQMAKITNHALRGLKLGIPYCATFVMSGKRHSMTNFLQGRQLQYWSLKEEHLSSHVFSFSRGMSIGNLKAYKDILLHHGRIYI